MCVSTIFSLNNSINVSDIQSDSLQFYFITGTVVKHNLKRVTNLQEKNNVNKLLARKVNLKFIL